MEFGKNFPSGQPVEYQRFNYPPPITHCVSASYNSNEVNLCVLGLPDC